MVRQEEFLEVPIRYVHPSFERKACALWARKFFWRTAIDIARSSGTELFPGWAQSQPVFLVASVLLAVYDRAYPAGISRAKDCVMNTLCANVLPSLDSGRPVVLVTLTDQSGSTPRAAGARMLVFADGSIRGTVGGWRYEAEAIEAGLALHRSEAAADPTTARPGSIVRYSLCGVDDMDMICGGALTLLLEYLPAGDSPARAAFAFGSKEEAAGRAFSFVTRITAAESGRACAGGRSGTGLPLPEGTISVKVERFAIAAPPPGGRHYIHPAAEIPEPVINRTLAMSNASLLLIREEGQDWLLEHFPSPFRVILFGGGHVSLETARLAQSVGFRVTVIDDRPEFANAGRFPGADVVLLPSLGEQDTAGLLSRLHISPRDAQVILTRGHAYDREALAASLRTPAGYIGMIGSKRKRAAVYKALEACGVSPEQLRGVHSPIGLSIGAETPAEIAVSIVGELILWRSGGRRSEAV